MLYLAGDIAEDRLPLVVHGDRFDAMVRYAKCLNHVPQKLGFTYWTYWPPSAYLKHQVKNAVEMEGVHYCNDGDWVDSSTAPVEPANGELQTVALAASRRLKPAGAAA
jgi:UDP-2,3-diacylglucosamine pyrophosphatase LpxH